MELLPPVGAGAKDSPLDSGLNRSQRGVARPPGAVVGERENERERDSGVAAVMNNGQPRQSSQLNFEQGQGQQGQPNINSNQNL